MADSVTVVEAIENTEKLLDLLNAIKCDGIFEAAGRSTGIEAYINHAETFTKAMSAQAAVLLPVILGTINFADEWQSAQTGFDRDRNAAYRPSDYIAAWLENARACYSEIEVAMHLIDRVPTSIADLEKCQRSKDSATLENEFRRSASMNAWDGGVKVCYDDSDDLQDGDYDNDVEDETGNSTQGWVRPAERTPCHHEIRSPEWCHDEPHTNVGWGGSTGKNCPVQESELWNTPSSTNDDGPDEAGLETDHQSPTTLQHNKGWSDDCRATPDPQGRGRGGHVIGNDNNPRWGDLESEVNSKTWTLQQVVDMVKAAIEGDEGNHIPSGNDKPLAQDRSKADNDWGFWHNESTHQPPSGTVKQGATSNSQQNRRHHRVIHRFSNNHINKDSLSKWEDAADTPGEDDFWGAGAVEAGRRKPVKKSTSCDEWTDYPHTNGW